MKVRASVFNMVYIELSVATPLPPTVRAHRPELLNQIRASDTIPPLLVFEGLLAFLTNRLTGFVLDAIFSIAVAGALHVVGVAIGASFRHLVLQKYLTSRVFFIHPAELHTNTADMFGVVVFNDLGVGEGIHD